MKLPPRNRYWL